MATVATTPRAHPPRVVAAGLVAFLLLAVVLARVFASYEDGAKDGVVEGSGVTAVETRGLPAFTAVDLAGTNQLSVQVGREQRVVVTADDNLIDRITTKVRSGELVISERGSFDSAAEMHVDVTVPELEGVTLSGTGAITVEGIDASRFRLRLLGSGVVTLRGEAEHVDASVAGSGDARLWELVAQDVVATVSGSGMLGVHAKRSLAASVPGSGAIVYVGNPHQLTRSVVGSGAIVEG